MITMLEKEHGIIWGDLPTYKKRGWCTKPNLISDWDIPRFNKNREYIENLLPSEE
jgi:hypothetical protein